MPILRLTEVIDPSVIDSSVINPNEIYEQVKDISATNVFAAVVTAVVSIFVIKVLLTLMNRAFSKSKLDPQVRKLLRMLMRVALYFVAVILVLGALDIEVTSLVAVLSIIGLAFSLAMQNFLSNVAGGMQLFASRPFKPGDWVEVGGVTGCVTEVDMFYTKINTVDNKLVHLPNSVIVTQTISNWSAEPLRRVELKPSASYDAPPQLVLDTLRALVCGDPRVMTDQDIFVHVNSYGDSSIEYILRVWCKNEDYWPLYFDLMDTLKPTFDAAGIEITYPHLNVHLDPHDPAAPPKSVPNAEEQ